MSVKRVLVLLVAVLMASVSLLGCQPIIESRQGDSTTTSGTTEEKPVVELPHVNLLMYMAGSEGVDQGSVLTEVNKMLADLNVTLEMKIVPTADVTTKYPLIFASGESFDLIFTAGWAGYKPQAEKGGFLELTDDMLQTYMPKTMANMKPVNWKPVMVDGKKYLIPRTDYTFNPVAIGIRGDLREKYNLPKIDSIEDYELFLDTIAKNEQNILPYGDNNNPNCWLLANVMLNIPNGWHALTSSSSDLLFYKVDDMTGEEAFVREETPEYLEWIKKMADWRKRGYWSNSALTAKGTPIEQFEAGKSASYIHHTLATSVGLFNTIKKNHPDWKVEIYDATFGQKISYTIPIAGFALSATTKNPERSLMVLEKFKTDRELYDLAQYGIKGKHYELSAEGNVLPGPKTGDNGNISYYGMKTGEFERLPGETFPGYDEIVKSCPPRQFFNPCGSFSLQVGDNIKNEFAACKNIFDQTRPILNLGFSDNPEEELKQYLDKMYAAGYAKVIEEEKQQLIKFVKEY